MRLFVWVLLVLWLAFWDLSVSVLRFLDDFPR